jgi:hypothetical protein
MIRQASLLHSIIEHPNFEKQYVAYPKSACGGAYPSSLMMNSLKV